MKNKIPVIGVFIRDMLDGEITAIEFEDNIYRKESKRSEERNVVPVRAERANSKGRIYKRTPTITLWTNVRDEFVAYIKTNPKATNAEIRPIMRKFYPDAQDKSLDVYTSVYKKNLYDDAPGLELKTKAEITADLNKVVKKRENGYLRNRYTEEIYKTYSIRLKKVAVKDLTQRFNQAPQTVMPVEQVDVLLAETLAKYVKRVSKGRVYAYKKYFVLSGQIRLFGNNKDRRYRIVRQPEIPKKKRAATPLFEELAGDLPGF